MSLAMTAWNPLPRKPLTRWARPGPRPDGLTPGQAAIAAVRGRTGSTLDDLAMTEGLSTTRITDAYAVLRYAPELAEHVTAGGLPLTHAAIVARLRHLAPDLAVKAERRLVTGRKPPKGPRGQGARLWRLWAQAALRQQKAGDRRYGPRHLLPPAMRAR